MSNSASTRASLLSELISKRAVLVRRIYEPLTRLEKGSPEFTELLQSGKVWEDHFDPGNSSRYGYYKLQDVHERSLQEIDQLKKSMRLPDRSIIESLIAEYAHQSVMIEDNKLGLGDSALLNDHLTATFFESKDIASMSASELAETKLPDLQSLLPGAEPSQVAELRNHIIASHWVAHKALQSVGTSGLNEEEVKCLSSLIIRGTSSEGLYSRWGGYRQNPVGVASDLLRVFPYHLEVPALMQRFFEWRDNKKDLHPLILACQATTYFLFIHPFPDGNGRVSRLIMQDLLTRQGYVPVVLKGVAREDYLRMIIKALDEDPGEFVAKVVAAQLQTLQTFS
ncbi:fic/DOC family protein [Chaetomium strumarium]|uniref:Fic/DOC family protein n=1 Tax=Chaetomium strumarium TaxID=1170767 RepID=A0AAJ0GKW7_9PEZI|nr:fic/DOC family protein [Chaetomium strumarium]